MLGAVPFPGGVWLVLLAPKGDVPGWKTLLKDFCGKLFEFVFELFFKSLEWLMIGLLALAFLTQCVGINPSHAAEIPKAAGQYQATLIRSARAVWGMDAPIAVFGAQVHQESGWRATAKSPVGAAGLAQFMPATAKWMPNIDAELAGPAPYNPGWALRALVRYDLFLWGRARAPDPYERMAFVLSAYNGGETRLNRERDMAAREGRDPAVWFGNVEHYNAGRSKSNWRENRGYPRRILQELMPLYMSWGPGVRHGR
jgi:hypothetical protein